jgi:hypothetical protein
MIAHTQAFGIVVLYKVILVKIMLQWEKNIIIILFTKLKAEI